MPRFTKDDPAFVIFTGQVAFVHVLRMFCVTVL